MRKKILPLFFAVVFLMTFLAGAFCSGAEETEKLTPTVSPIDGVETVVFTENTALTGSITCRSVPERDPSDSLLWLITSKNNGYIFQSVGNELYLNLSKDGVTLGTTAQVLTVTKSSGGSLISRGSYYLKLSKSKWTVTSNKQIASVMAFRTGAVREYDNSGEDPLYTVACFSDLHVDYGIQNNNPPIRQSTIVAAQAVKDLGGADVMIVGGDVVSGNSNMGWNEETFKKVKRTVYNTLTPATTTGNVLLVTGNHDNEPAVFAGDRYYSGNYDDIMLNNAGDFVASLYSTELEYPEESTRFNELLCYRYSFDGMEIIGLNTPYRPERTSGYIYGEQITWLTKQLSEIGRDKTVIVYSHYPVSHVVSPAGNGGGDANMKLKTALSRYPNVIYCYGHIHSGPNMTWYDTRENVVPARLGAQQDNGAYKTSGYISCHMGSMGYYETHYQPGTLTKQDPMVVQFLMIDFYADHITFKYYNVGETNPDPDVKEITSFTVLRDMFQLTGGTPSGGTVDSDGTDDASTQESVDTDSLDPESSVEITDDGSASPDPEITTDAPVPSVGTDAATSAGFPVGAVVCVSASVLILLAGGGFCLWYLVLRKKTKEK